MAKRAVLQSAGLDRFPETSASNHSKNGGLKISSSYHRITRSGYLPMQLEHYQSCISHALHYTDSLQSVQHTETLLGTIDALNTLMLYWGVHVKVLKHHCIVFYAHSLDGASTSGRLS
ncbi:hypothetical protein SS1G_12710 [Sclerotinia sclerotiorum 1980 UF-70]|uniref:Uncharacterized protein n=1 Tax=Sclerotinia sclerotiorum (strain ATCC 18683 / 1980 / Ss-1) TaxID=665079 RepID=A7F535_SCLS1|nr:hypothetical protein SS1G_12710 [Sclerotinia sclerotiorum 1980 UF-70]EDN97856.1 hypothetical protein SS1G_12710 [Sclerotinia sclerotiorum 1980 UF-70]